MFALSHSVETTGSIVRPECVDRFVKAKQADNEKTIRIGNDRINKRLVFIFIPPVFTFAGYFIGLLIIRLDFKRFFGWNEGRGRLKQERTESSRSQIFFKLDTIRSFE